MTYAKTKEEFLKLANNNGITHFIALYSFYQEPYVSNPNYMEPYNAILRDLIKLSPGESFFLERFMAQQRAGYIVVDINQLNNRS